MAKREYEPPEIVGLGSIERLTLDGLGDGVDGEGFGGDAIPTS